MAVALSRCPAAHASVTYGPAMSAAQIRAMQAQGVREIIVKRDPGLSAAQEARRAGAGGHHATSARAASRTPSSTRRRPAGWPPRWRRSRQDPAGPVRRAQRRDARHLDAERPVLRPAVGARRTPGSSVSTRAVRPATTSAPLYAWPHSTGAGVTVAVVDTGADYSATDLAGRLAPRVRTTSTRQRRTGPERTRHARGRHHRGRPEQRHRRERRGARRPACCPCACSTRAGPAPSTPWPRRSTTPASTTSRSSTRAWAAPDTSQALADAVTSNPGTLYVVAAGNGDANRTGYDVDADAVLPVRHPGRQPDLRRRLRPERPARAVLQLRRGQRRPVRPRRQHPLHLPGAGRLRVRRRHLDGAPRWSRARSR